MASSPITFIIIYNCSCMDVMWRDENKCTFYCLMVWRIVNSDSVGCMQYYHKITGNEVIA